MFRAFAVSWVVLYHINVFFDLGPLLGKFFPIFFKISDPGELGVDLFFVLSGFLISGLLLPDLDSHIRVKRFYGRRFFKIIPQYLVATLIGLLISHAMSPFNVIYRQVGWGYEGLTYFHSHNPQADVLSHFLFYQNFAQRVGILSHTWSLAIEEHFYFLFPLLLAAICRITPQLKWRRAILFGVLVAFLASITLVRAYYVNAEGIRARPFIFNRYDAIAFGCLLRLLEPEFQRIPDSAWRPLSIAFLILGISIFLSYIVLGFNRMSLAGYPRAYVASGLLILAFLRGEPWAFLKVIMNNKTLIAVGKISYGLYLWHYIIAYPFHQWSFVLGVPTSVALYLGAVLAAGLLSTNVIEKYFLDLRARALP